MLKTLETSTKKTSLLGLRRAFTLVELIVVIAIIGFLAAVTTGVVVRVIESQRRASTQLLIDTINNALSTQASKLVDQTRRSVDSTTSGDADADIKALILSQWNLIFVDSLAKASLNQSYNAMNTGLNLANVNSFNGLSLPNGSVVKVAGGKHDPAPDFFEKSYSLFMVLKVGKFSALDPESLGRGAVQYASGSGTIKVPFIVDQWGDPIIILPGSPGTPPKAISSNL